MQLHIKQSSKTITYKTNASMNCEISHVNYIFTTFVKIIKAILLKKYFSKVILINEKELIAATHTVYTRLSL